MLVWRFLDASGGEAGRSQPFDDRESAESWISENWEDLAGSGIQEVVLADAEDDSPLYRMGLREE